MESALGVWLVHMYKVNFVQMRPSFCQMQQSV